MAAEDCGTKHIKLASVIVGIVIAVVSASSGIVLSRLYASESTLGQYEQRLRVVEQQSVRIEERLIAIQQTLNRIEGVTPNARERNR